MKALIAFCIFLIPGLTACTIYIEDPIDPRLPKYSEKGYNTSGALINDDAWTSKSNYWGERLSIESYPSCDSVIISIPGHLTDSKSIDLHFVLHFHLADATGLYSLQDQEIVLDGVVNQGMYSSFNAKYTGGEGKLFIRNVQVHDSSDFTISGTFGFTIPDTDVGQIEVSYGRFDYHSSDLILPENYSYHE